MPPSEESITVICVDDNDSLAELTATFLERHDDVFTAHAETDAEAALDRLDTEYDVDDESELTRDRDDERELEGERDRDDERELEGDDEANGADEPASREHGERSERIGVGRPTIDCIVSDYDMPGMNGLEFLEAVRESYHDLPFILFTGKGSEEIASEAITAGVTDYLQKQASTDQYVVLANRVRNAVESYRAQRALEQSELLFDAIFEDPTTFIAILEPDGRLTNVNRTALEFVGGERAELRGEPFWELPWWDHSEELQAKLREWIRRAADGEYVEYEATHYGVDDDRIVVDGTIRPVTRGDEVVALIAEGRAGDSKQRERISI